MIPEMATLCKSALPSVPGIINSLSNNPSELNDEYAEKYKKPQKTIRHEKV